MIAKETALLFINALGESNCCLELPEFCTEIETKMVAAIKANPLGHTTTTIGQLVDLVESPMREDEEDHKFIAVVHGLDCYFRNRSDAHSVARHMMDTYNEYDEPFLNFFKVRNLD